MDRLGVALVGALGGDEIHHLLDDVDVRGLGVALHRAAEALFAGVAEFGCTARPGFLVKISADAAQTRWIREACERESETLRARGALHGDLPVFRNADRGGSCGNRLKAG